MARSGKVLLLLGLCGLAAAQIDPNVCPHNQQGVAYKAWSATSTWPNGVRFNVISRIFANCFEKVNACCMKYFVFISLTIFKTNVIECVNKIVHHEEGLIVVNIFGLY